MKIKFLLFSLLAFQLDSFGQFLSSGFQEMTLPATGYYNGDDLSGGFQSGPVFFRNSYNPNFFSWSGFGVSSKTDTSNGTFNNQYSCYAGTGGNNSTQFAIAYCYDQIVLKPANNQQVLKLQSFQFTNSTWAGRSMKFGDAFSKKFGGPTGNDPDFFKLRVFNYYGGVATDSADVYLADFRFGNNQEDYIVKEWRTANFNFSQPLDSIGFKLESTDVGQFGINTPTYFCLDNLVFTLQTNTIKPLDGIETLAYPNPFQSQLFLRKIDPETQVEIWNHHGQKVLTQKDFTGGQPITTTHLPAGIYWLKMGKQIQKLVKTEGN